MSANKLSLRRVDDAVVFVASFLEHDLEEDVVFNAEELQTNKRKKRKT